MKWPGQFQKLLYGCFGDRDEPIDSGPALPKKRVDTTRPVNPEPRSVTTNQDHAAIARSSGTTSERQQSEQSQSDATRSTTQPTSTEISDKVNTNPDDITSAAATPQPFSAAPIPVPDPDEISPVMPAVSRIANVTDALEDRRKLYERLRRKPEGDSIPSHVHPAVQQTTAALSKAEGKKPVLDGRIES